MTPAGFGELALVEGPALALLEQLGWETVVAFDEKMGADGTLGRDTQGDVVLVHRLRPKLRELNPGLPDEGIEQAVEKLVEDRSAMDPVRANREAYDLLRDGAKVSVVDADGVEAIETVRYVHWTDSRANEWLAASQVWVTGPLHKRRADIVGFVNGIPLLFLELKASHTKLENAYKDNLRDYRDTIPQLFWCNSFVILSNGSDTKVGSTYSPWEFFAEWKRIDSAGERGVVSLETALRGTCEPPRLLDLAENFVAFLERPGGLVKAFAKNHQYLGVNEALKATASLRELEGRLGVFWHTQGSGKSLSMLWFTQKVLRKLPGNWTFVMVTDRKELDGQLYGEFQDAGVITAGHVQATSGDHLRDLLAQDHRYVFTLIHKFRTKDDETQMPVLSERSDVIVITDEAHRSQYDTLALNMRNALPNASFLGFTGTPLISGEEQRTQEVFGRYVSTYNFQDSIADGATVPLFYENRIPELQIINETFSEELNELLEAAELDDDQERALARRFSREYQLITRSDRLDKVAEDLVAHFVGRGFKGKAMYVAIDKVTAVRMYELVQVEWGRQLGELKDGLAAAPELERPWIESQIEFMETTDMAVVVSQSQNEIAEMEEAGLDIKPHRQRMLTEDLDGKFKDPDDPFRLVFVCAMWMTGFDVPSCSTIYLDRPMRNHTLMQTIARANRVFPEKENGLIVDYIGVFRDLEKALAIYGAARPEDGGDSPIQDKSGLVAELGEAVEETTDTLEAHDIDLDALATARGFEFIALRDSAVEALLIDDDTKKQYQSQANRVRRLFKAILPDPSANAIAPTVAIIRNIAQRISSLVDPPDISGVMDEVEQLLDRSVGAEEYVIRAAAAGVEADPVIDLNKIDFDALAARFAGRKRTEAEKLAKQLGAKVKASAERNPTRIDFVERFERLLAEYNAGSLNIDEMLKRLLQLSQELTEEEHRVVTEDLTDEELAIFDLLTRPGPELSETEQRDVKAIARKLLEHIQEKLVLDWRKRMQSRAKIQVEVEKVLDELPEIYEPEVYDEKVEKVFEHIFDSYFGDGRSVYTGTTLEADRLPAGAAAAAANDLEAGRLTEDLIRRIQDDEEFARLVALQLRGEAASFALSIDELIAADENDQVEFKATARWNLKDEETDKRLELAIIKTVAGFLNTRGGTLLIGVRDDGVPMGLAYDYGTVKPANADGYVNWLTTMLIHAMGESAAMRTRIRIERATDEDVCRVDVSASSRPVWAKKSRSEVVFYARMNNSTREWPTDEVEAYIADRWPDLSDGPGSSDE